jgi:hypothetical protein
MAVIYKFDDHPNDNLWERLCIRSLERYNYTTAALWHPADKLERFTKALGGKVIKDSKGKFIALKFRTEADLLAFKLKI